MVEYLYDLGFDSEEIEELKEELDSSDYNYIFSNSDKIKKVFLLFDKIGIKNAKEILYNSTYIFYENLDFIKNVLEKNENSIELINEEPIYIDNLFDVC